MKTRCVSKHTPCRFTEKKLSFRSLLAWPRCVAALRFIFFKGETLYSQNVGRRGSSPPDTSDRQKVTFINVTANPLQRNRAVQYDGVPVFFVHMPAGEIAPVVDALPQQLRIAAQVKNFRPVIRRQTKLAAGNGQQHGIPFAAIPAPPDRAVRKLLPQKFQFIPVIFTEYAISSTDCRAVKSAVS